MVAAKIADYCKRSVAMIEKGDMSGAFNVWDQMLNGDIWPYGECSSARVRARVSE